MTVVPSMGETPPPITHFVAAEHDVDLRYPTSERIFSILGDVVNLSSMQPLS